MKGRALSIEEIDDMMVNVWKAEVDLIVPPTSYGPDELFLTRGWSFAMDRRELPTFIAFCQERGANTGFMEQALTEPRMTNMRRLEFGWAAPNDHHNEIHDAFEAYIECRSDIVK
jgi:hypothetical protein